MTESAAPPGLDPAQRRSIRIRWFLVGFLVLGGVVNYLDRSTLSVPIGCLWTLASDIAPPGQVASLGAIQNFGGFIGAAVAPVVTGAILTVTRGDYTLVFLVGGVLLLVGAVSYGLFVKDRPTSA